MKWAEPFYLHFTEIAAYSRKIIQQIGAKRWPGCKGKIHITIVMKHIMKHLDETLKCR